MPIVHKTLGKPASWIGAVIAAVIAAGAPVNSAQARHERRERRGRCGCCGKRRWDCRCPR